MLVGGIVFILGHHFSGNKPGEGIYGCRPLTFKHEPAGKYGDRGEM